MWGAVVGDIAGSRFEGSRGGPKDFELFHRLCTYTDDTVCTAAIADIIVNERKPGVTLQRWCRRHPDRGYGGYFREWIGSTVPEPYGSFGNGAAMRVSPVALLYRRRPLEEALEASDRVTAITHDHPEGIKGARAVTEAIWHALHGEGAESVRRQISTRYGYGLDRCVEDIRPSHRFDVSCQGTVPTALICAIESTSLEDAVRNAVSLGGDADTLAAIAGAVGEALHGLDGELVQTARERYLQGAEGITTTLDALYEAVVQIIDYCSSLESLTEADLGEHIASRSGTSGVEKIDDFQDWYKERWDRELAELRPIRMVLVGLGADVRAHRMVEYLAQRDVDITLFTFFGYKYGDRTLLARQVQAGEEIRVINPRRKQSQPDCCKKVGIL